MRWDEQRAADEDVSALPGLVRRGGLVRSVTTPEFRDVVFHEVMAKTALNKVPGTSHTMPFGWTVNPYRGCSHACVYCFARPTHRYLDLDTGADFDQQIVVKVNVAEVLRAEVRRGGWGRHPVALGTNTDPYQRAEGRYALMPGVVDALAGSGTPFSILTKGTLLRRDLPLLAAARRDVPIDLAMSIAIFDDELQQAIEPGTPSTAARLQTVRAATDAGFDCAVFLMPVLPYLTDTGSHLDRALAAIREAGATTVLYTALHLKPGVRPWFTGWLEREHPELVPKYEELYGTGSHAPEAYRRWLAARIRPLIARHGLHPGRADPSTGGPRSTALDAARDLARQAAADSVPGAVRRTGAVRRPAPRPTPTLF